MKKIFAACLIFSVITSLSAFGNCEAIKSKLPYGWNVSKIQVPFDWSKPGVDLLEVAYYHKDQGLYPGKTPIIFFNGGPTVSGSVAVKLLDGLKEFRGENLIILDQRGNGCSTPFKQYTGKNLDVYKSYASDSIVRDAEEIRKLKFNGVKWKIFGQSYGGLISFRYIELYPEGIHSAHIHGFGFSENDFMLDLREKRIKFFTQEILNYKNPKSSDLSIGELYDALNGLEGDKKDLLNTMCVATQRALRPKLCGLEFFKGVYYITGFRDRWTILHKFMATLLKNLQDGNEAEAQKTYSGFVSTYVLRFNDLNQAAAMNAIVNYELFPGRFIYDGCIKAEENKLISECRFSTDYILRMDERPVFTARPHDLDVIRENIHSMKIPVYYYAGYYDSFLPLETLQWTAERLGITNSFTVFPESGHEGFYTENRLLEEVIR